MEERGSDGKVLTITDDENIFDCPNIENTPDTAYGYALNRNIWSEEYPKGVHPIDREGNPSALLRMAEPAWDWHIGSELCSQPEYYPDRHLGGALYLFADGHTEWLEANLVQFRWTNGKYNIQDKL
ncbi:MAG: hypothetical protein JXA11_16165 [Phycisphaerae bacterium]|nr:hypothetical protein [Phycisphaerae bacterium]